MSTIESAVTEMGRFAANLQWDDVPQPVRERIGLIMLDTLGVTIAGASTPELAALRNAWSLSPGPASVIGTELKASAHDAMWLNGIASCCLELDEGNKYARGHPTAHVLFATLAEAEPRTSPWSDVMLAFLVGHEVASRFGRSMRPMDGLHTHGHWGALGAAAAVARLRGADATAVAGAIDAAAGLVLASPWESALRGSFVRNTWIGAANVAGTVAAQISLAGLTSVDGTPKLTLGGLLGELDVKSLTRNLGQSFDICLGYLKRHPSCSYTHPPIDAILALTGEGGAEVDQILDILVETNRLAAPLVRTSLPTRLSAMFSIPYVVAIALTEGQPIPESFDDAHRSDPQVQELMQRVRVCQTEEMNAKLPQSRAARVTLTLKDGRQLRHEVPNPVGDADYMPFGRPEIIHKLQRLLGADRACTLVNRLDSTVDGDDSARWTAALGV